MCTAVSDVTWTYYYWWEHKSKRKTPNGTNPCCEGLSPFPISWYLSALNHPLALLCVASILGSDLIYVIVALLDNNGRPWHFHKPTGFSNFLQVVVNLTRSKRGYKRSSGFVRPTERSPSIAADKARKEASVREKTPPSPRWVNEKNNKACGQAGVRLHLMGTQNRGNNMIPYILQVLVMNFPRRPPTTTKIHQPGWRRDIDWEICLNPFYSFKWISN